MNVLVKVWGSKTARVIRSAVGVMLVCAVLAKMESAITGEADVEALFDRWLLLATFMCVIQMDVERDDPANDVRGRRRA